jgi:hypothetical protein
MQSTYGKIGIQTRSAKLSIHQQKADLTIRQPKAEMRINRKPGKLDIDQSQAFAEEHLKSVFAWTRENASRGRKAALEGVGRRAAEGDRLMKIENGGRPIADLAEKNSSDPPLAFNIGWMPKSAFSVKFYYQPSKLKIHWQLHDPVINATPNLPQYAYQSGSVIIFMKQRPSLDIQVSGLRYDDHI